MNAISLAHLKQKFDRSQFPIIVVKPINSDSQSEVGNALPAEIIQEAHCRFKSEKRRLEWLLTRFLIKKICGDNTLINYHETGRPYLSGNHHNVCISISHTSGYLAIALHSVPIGIDIQQHQEKLINLYPRFMNNQEIGNAATYFSENEYPLMWWCAKEAVYKLVDQPGTPLKEGFNIYFDSQTRCLYEHNFKAHIIYRAINESTGLAIAAHNPLVDAEFAYLI